jgi:hypothetical protein
VLAPSWRTSVDVLLSDICVKDRQKHGDARSISRRNTMIFILVQTLSWSNSPTSSHCVKV